MAAQPERDAPFVSSASLPLVAKFRIRAQKTKHNGGSDLYIARQIRKRLHEQASQVNGCEINNCDDCRDLGNQKRPKQASSVERRLMRTTAVIAY